MGTKLYVRGHNSLRWHSCRECPDWPEEYADATYSPRKESDQCPLCIELNKG